MDIMLGQDGDLLLTGGGDIQIENTALQKIMIRLRWMLGEWRWNKEVGLPYFEQLLIKNPDIHQFELLIRNEIMKVKEVTGVQSVTVITDHVKRTAVIRFRAVSGSEKVGGEVKL